MPEVVDVADDGQDDRAQSCFDHVVVLHVEVLEDLQRDYTLGFVFRLFGEYLLEPVDDILNHKLIPLGYEILILLVRLAKEPSIDPLGNGELLLHEQIHNDFNQRLLIGLGHNLIPEPQMRIHEIQCSPPSQGPFIFQTSYQSIQNERIGIGIVIFLGIVVDALFDLLELRGHDVRYAVEWDGLLSGNGLHLDGGAVLLLGLGLGDGRGA